MLVFYAIFACVSQCSAATSHPNFDSVMKKLGMTNTGTMPNFNADPYKDVTNCYADSVEDSADCVIWAWWKVIAAWAHQGRLMTPTKNNDHPFINERVDPSGCFKSLSSVYSWDWYRCSDMTNHPNGDSGVNGALGMTCPQAYDKAFEKTFHGVTKTVTDIPLSYLCYKEYPVEEIVDHVWNCPHASDNPNGKRRRRNLPGHCTDDAYATNRLPSGYPRTIPSGDHAGKDFFAFKEKRVTLKPIKVSVCVYDASNPEKPACKSAKTCTIVSAEHFCNYDMMDENPNIHENARFKTVTCPTATSTTHKEAVYNLDGRTALAACGMK